jgi:hypothetical protein
VDAPARLEPLVVERASVLTLTADPSAPTSFSAGSGRIVATSDGAATVLTGSGLRDGEFELIAGDAASAHLPTAQALIQVREGRFELSVPNEIWAARARGEPLRLVTFDAARSFSPPGQ